MDELPASIKGLIELWGRSVFHCRYCDGWESRDKSIAVLGAPESDASKLGQLAMVLKRCVSDDIVVCPNGAGLDETMRKLLIRLRIGIRDGQVSELRGKKGQLEHVIFSDDSTLQRQIVFIEPPKRQHSNLAIQLGVRQLEDGSVEIDEFGQTSLVGVFSAGDMARRASMPLPGAQVVLAIGSGVVAAFGIERALFQLDLQKSA